MSTRFPPDAAGAGDEPAVSVLIADDQALVRSAFAALVDAVPGMHVVGTAADGAEAVELAAKHRPDVVLMDVRMPRMDGITATREIISADKAEGGVGTGPRVLILTTFDLDEYVFSALRAGAGGFLLKDTPPDDLVTAIRVIAAGEALLAPTVTRRLIEEFARRPEPATAPHQSLQGVTEREREVLVLIGRGMSNAEIAAHLHLAAATVKTHVSRLLMKLAARDRAQLVIAAYESGLLNAAP
ncbi:response regulator transcription factor [Actinospica sp. MGRD01-02]|uniref:Response regulator transcription factor n=1 Tax=Actinospica acidithermotolerans TaxID=2828514 RepID=A0A941IMJ3_9ACTN|nr:response regulator transcription factor [Actinospica acidithermotolerans]MBR7830053.1 response regulator transcription factor [Actinospica acidithermotolerans]